MQSYISLALDTGLLSHTTTGLVITGQRHTDVPTTLAHVTPISLISII
jgi:hypothetical protein